ncbi:DNA translocase FtsK [Dongshaea marina]|uniref:DNA translocase FtsK n=1 Tax=Dongshaea marina TaxID=2047966 RepID=UPI000D3EC22C|nr:DNA translocase FtsK [Dongshaea marina]
MSALSRVMEACLIIVGVSALYLLIALISYSPADPGWSQTAWSGPIHNVAGRFGAWVADVLLFGFGFWAYLLPFLLLFIAKGLLWRPKPFFEWDFLTLGLRLVGLLLIWVGSSTLASFNTSLFGIFAGGGLIGEVMIRLLWPLLGTLGLTLLQLCLIGAGFPLFSGCSWLLVIEKVGAGVIQGAMWLWNISDTWQKMAQGLPRIRLWPLRRASAELEGGMEDSVPTFLETPEPAPVKRLPRKPKRKQETPLEPVLTTPEIEEESPIPMVDPEIEPQASPMGDMPWETESGETSQAPWQVAQVQPEELIPGQESQEALEPLPSVELLDQPKQQETTISEEEQQRMAALVESKLADYNVLAKVVGVYPGPVITRFELELAPGVKVSKITNLSRDLARSLSAMSVRVVEVIPGKPYVGLELPNRFRQTVFLREVFDSEAFRDIDNPLALVLGQDIAGDPVVVNLGKMPHLLVAGTTGSGKSVGVNVMILSMLYKASPEDVRFIMIDPKMLELSVYEGIPHLLSEVVTDMKEAANALRWCVGEMERRYQLMSALGVRNLKGYNSKIEAGIKSGQPLCDPLWRPGDSMDEMPPALEKLPSIVVVIDEFADMMMIVGKKVEELIARIAQKARAAGIHLILATQRPSVDVITGLIKANIPTRISFQVSSKIDSRTILDQPGAESLLGMGDMLYLPAGESAPTRVHGAFVDDHEVHRVVADWKLRGKPNYIEAILSGESSSDILLPGEQSSDEELDPLFDEAVAFVVESRRGSTSSVQRRFKIGYNRAARIIEQMEAQGIVSPPGGNGQRDVLAPPPMKE